MEVKQIVIQILSPISSFRIFVLFPKFAHLNFLGVIDLLLLDVEFFAMVQKCRDPTDFLYPTFWLFIASS
jgi:hypothetical protein